MLSMAVTSRFTFLRDITWASSVRNRGQGVFFQENKNFSGVRNYDTNTDDDGHEIPLDTDSDTGNLFRNSLSCIRFFITF